jgi:LPXTG-site transpeptidase (sortase) family protein
MDHRLRSLYGLILLVALLLPVVSCAASPADPPVGWIIAPSIGLYRAVYVVPIVDRHYSDAALVGRVGWLEGTNWIHDPGGHVVLAGHSYGVFRDIDQLRAGDVIMMLDRAGAVVYVVRGWRIVRADEWQWLARGVDTLTLITCEGEARRLVFAERTN